MYNTYNHIVLALRLQAAFCCCPSIPPCSLLVQVCRAWAAVAGPEEQLACKCGRPAHAGGRVEFDLVCIWLGIKRAWKEYGRWPGDLLHKRQCAMSRLGVSICVPDLLPGRFLSCCLRLPGTGMEFGGMWFAHIFNWRRHGQRTLLLNVRLGFWGFTFKCLKNIWVWPLFLSCLRGAASLRTCLELFR